MTDSYTNDELNALKGIFSLYDPDKSGVVSHKELDGLLEKVSASPFWSFLCFKQP